LLFLFATGCRLTELVNVKKKKRQRLDVNDNSINEDNMNDKDFNEIENNINTDFGFDNNHDNTIIDLGSKNNNNSFNNNITISDIETESRQFDTLYYKDICLLVVRNLIVKERDILAIKVKLTYYKRAKRRPKP
jgi:hypothetical protein